MKSLREKTPTFDTPIVVARESFAGDLRSGVPFVVRIGDRRQAADEVVTRWPMFWQDDGTELVPFERPEPPDDEPSPILQRPPRKMLRSRKDWSEERPYISQNGWGVEERRKVRIVLQKDGLTNPNEWWLGTLSDKERERLFEEVEA